MALQPFNQAYAKLTGQPAPSNTSSNKVGDFGTAYKQVIQSAQQKPAPQPTVKAAHVSASQPVTPQQSNPFQDIAGQIYRGAVKVGQMIEPQKPSVQQAPKVTQPIKLPMGLRLDFVNAPKQPSAQSSAQMTTTPKSIQQQKNSVATGNKIDNVFKGTLDQVQQIAKDPLATHNLPNLIKNPKKVLDDFLNTVPKAYNDIGKNVQNIKTDFKTNAPTSQKAGDILKTIASQGNFIASPITAIFGAADKVPVLGTLSRLLSLPFTIAGEGATAVSNKIVDTLPISQQAKSNIKPGMGEIFSLAAQLALGKVTEIGMAKKAQLASKYGTKDASTIVDQATQLAKEKTIQPGTYDPQGLRNEVFTKKLEDTAHGKEIIKATMQADQAGQHISIKPESIDTFDKNLQDYKSFGGATDGTETENAALRDIETASNTPEIKTHTQEQVKQAIASGEIKPNEDGTITLYRGGKPSEKNNLVSASYDKNIAQQFSGEGNPVHEVKVKPDDIKAFIGKAEKEVLIQKDRVITEEKPKEVTVKEYTKNGREVQPKGYKKVLTTGEVHAVRDVMDAKLTHIRETSTGTEDYGRQIDALVKDITDRSQGDKSVLSALRTELNKEMFGVAGASGNYKEAYATLMSVRKTDPEMGGLIDNFQNHIEKLDNTLISTPDKNYQVPAFAKERVKKQISFKGANEPVGTGAPKQSRAFKRVVEHLAETDPELYNKIKDDPKLLYNTVNQNYDFENAEKIVAENPDKAYRIAKQLEPAPVGQRWESVSIVLADRALADKNIPLWKELEQSRSLSQTRAGQGIVAEKGRFDDASPHTFMQKVLDARLKRLGGGNLTDAIKMGASKVGKTTLSAKEKAFAKIDHVVERAQKFTAKERSKINFAQKLLDELTCK